MKKDKNDKKDLLKFLKDLKKIIDDAEWQMQWYYPDDVKKIGLIITREKVEQLDRIIENFEEYYGER